MAWRARPERLTEMMELMPDLAEYIRDSDYPEERKTRLMRWMVRRNSGSGDSDRSSGDDNGYGTSVRRRQRNDPAPKRTKTKLGRWLKSFSHRY